MTLVTITLTLAISCATADSYRVFGTIATDAGQPIVGVRVSVSGADEVAMTDSRGDYEVADVPEGSVCIVKPSHPDYSFEPKSREVTITSGDEWGNFTANDAQMASCSVAVAGGSSDKPSALSLKGPAVTYPSAAGITWIRGDDYTITWQGFTTTNVRIQLWKNWALHTTITTGTSWTPDFSDNPFTIAAGGGGVTRRAVCVGISDYVGTGSDLNYCDDDARDFTAALAAQSNWNAGNITTLLDRNATAANIWAALNAMSAASDSNDQCVFFFSGHGGWSTDQAPIDEPNNRDEYICETDLTNNIYDDALGQWVTDLPTTNVLVVLCSCFSGGFIKGENSVKCISGAQPGGAGDGFAAEIQAAMDAKASAVKDIDDAGAGVTLTAANYNETCQESGTLQHDVFNHYVLQAMGGAGDANSDGTITAEEIYAYAAPHATNFNSSQHAQIYDTDPGQDFVLLY